MKILLKISQLLIFLCLFGCNESRNETKAPIKNNEIVQKDTIVSECGYEKYLKDSRTPKSAKELFYNRYKLIDDEPLDLLDSLLIKDLSKRQFYFRVITNSYKISDGAYSEGLGNIGKEYIENHTKEFLAYFDNKNCFNDKDLETWADIAILEFSIIGEVEDNRYDKSIISNYEEKLLLNCMDCSIDQKATLEKFNKLLEAKWQTFIKA